MRVEPVAELVDVLAHPVTGFLDLTLDLFGTLIAPRFRGRVEVLTCRLVSEPGILSLVLTHDRCSFAHWTSSFRVSTVRRGARSTRFSSFRPFCNITYPTIARTAPTINADTAREMFAKSRIARISAATSASPPR